MHDNQQQPVTQNSNDMAYAVTQDSSERQGLARSDKLQNNGKCFQ